jgi:hypothetical protein
MQTVSQAYSPQEACAFRVDFYPVSSALDTRKKLNPILQDLRGENDIKLVRDTSSASSDNYARDICKEYEDWIASLETTPHFRANIYAFADNTFKAKVLLNAAGAEALSEGDFAIAPIRPDADGLFTLFSRMGQQPADYCRYAQEATAKGWDTSWSTTFCLPEVVPFFRLPTLDLLRGGLSALFADGFTGDFHLVILRQSKVKLRNHAAVDKHLAAGKQRLYVVSGRVQLL